MVGVSQTYISRLEAGSVAPASRVATALKRLSENPRTRSVFDDFLSSVRHSPYRCVLISVEADGNCTVIAASPVMDKDLIGEAETLDTTMGCEALCRQAKSLIETGLAEGGIAAARGVWLDLRPDEPAHWQTHYTPVRDEAGSWYIHLTLTALDARAYAAWHGERGEGLELQYFETGADSAEP